MAVSQKGIQKKSNQVNRDREMQTILAPVKVPLTTLYSKITPEAEDSVRNLRCYDRCSVYVQRSLRT